MKCKHTLLIALVGASLMVLPACNKGEGEGKTEKATTAAKAVKVKIGDSCKGMSAADGKISCDGNKMIFCSSYSDYKWKLQKECESGTKCVVGADGTSAGCE